MKLSLKLRKARHDVRHFAKKFTEAQTEQAKKYCVARYERAIAFLAAHKLSGTVIHINGSPPPLSLGDHSAQDIARPLVLDTDGKSLQDVAGAERQTVSPRPPQGRDRISRYRRGEILIYEHSQTAKTLAQQKSLKSNRSLQTTGRFFPHLSTVGAGKTKPSRAGAQNHSGKD